jgi:hypothetical protein
MSIPAPALPNVYLVRIEATLAGEPCANVIAVADVLVGHTITSLTAEVEDVLSTELQASAGTTYQGIVSNGRTYQNLHVVEYDAASPNVADLALAGAEYTGNSAAHLLPPQNAIVVSLTTGLASRRKRGRLYDYGFTEADNEATGVISATAVTAVTDFWTAVLGEFAARDIPWGVLSRGWVNEGPGDTRPSFAQSWTAITGATVRDNKWDTMRSRVPR